MRYEPRKGAVALADSDDDCNDDSPLTPAYPVTEDLMQKLREAKAWAIWRKQMVRATLKYVK